jgi:RNA polymerase sigma factor (sigma-70 family)
MMINFKRNNYKNYSDEELILAFNNGKERIVLGEFYIRYAHLIMGVGLKYLSNQQEAEDMTMHLFEKLPSKLKTNSIQTFKPWLYMVAKNECLMFLRKKGIKTTTLMLEPEDVVGTIELENEERYKLLELAISELKDDQKTCIKLFFLEKKSYEEITNILKMDVKKVKSAIQNGKRNLKLKLEARNEFK